MRISQFSDHGESEAAAAMPGMKMDDPREISFFPQPGAFTEAQALPTLSTDDTIRAAVQKTGGVDTLIRMPPFPHALPLLHQYQT